MRTTCLRHPARSRVLVIHLWMMDYCNQNACAAALISLLAYWHDNRLAYIQKNALSIDHDELWEPHSMKELSDGLLGLYAEDTIRDALAFLKKAGAVQTKQGKGYNRATIYLFCPDKLNAWLDLREAVAKGPQEAQLPLPENRASIPEKSGVDTGKVVDHIPEKSGISKDKETGDSPSEHQKFVDLWFVEYEATFGSKYVFNSKDFSALKHLLKNSKHTAEELMEVVRSSWTHRNDRKRYFWCSQSLSICAFATRINEIRAEIGVPKANQFAATIEAARQRSRTTQ